MTTERESREQDEKTPGDAAGVPVPNEHAAPGTSEQFTAVDGVLDYPEESSAE